MTFQFRPALYPSAYDQETDMVILSSTRDMPDKTTHVTITIGGYLAFGFNLMYRFDEHTKTVVYCAPLEKIRSGFSRKRNMLQAFKSENVFISKLKEGVEFLLPRSSMPLPGWKIQVVFV